MKKLIFVLLTVLMVGCKTTKSVLADISLGMSKKDVSSSIGKPKSVRGSIKNKYDQIIEVWEYQLCDYPFSSFVTCDNYWMYFADGRLVQWGQAGDWGKEANAIYEVRFR